VRLGRLARQGRPVPAPRIPWTAHYLARHRRFVERVLDDPTLIGRFRRDERLPSGYGIGFDERVIEYPWLLAHEPAGRVLDAGSTLNHEHVLRRFLPQCDDLHLVTLAPEPESFPDLGVVYCYADLRDLPYPDRSFDTVVAASTLEHIGMDTTSYGVPGDRSPEPNRELEQALSELRRVLTSGGRLLVTVPYGRAEDHGWFRQFGREDVGFLTAVAGWRTRVATVYRYSRTGWQLSDLEEAADERYWDHHEDPIVPEDRAAAARAVVCLLLAA
jgi:SAM-dependent methyltransferase